MTPYDLTTKLMAIPSVTGSEGEAGDFLARHLSSLGYRVQRQEVGPGRFNVIAFAGEAVVVLCSHIDTVPPVLPIGQDEAFLYGRGSCDAKGIIAAAMRTGAMTPCSDEARST
jgi:acetylornithine deacetylase